MRTGITLFVLILALSVSAYADYTRVGSIPVYFPEAPEGYAVTGLETIGDSLFMTVAVDSNSAIYLIDPIDGDIFTSYFWQLTMPSGTGDPSLSGAAFEPPFYYWVCDAYSDYFLNLTWSGGDTVAIYYYWVNDRITDPGGVEYEEYATLWAVDGPVDSLYAVEPYGMVYGAYEIPGSGSPSAVTLAPPPPDFQEGSNLLFCYDTLSDSVYEYTTYGSFVQGHYLEGSPFDGAIYAATFYDGMLYLGGQDDSIYIFAPTESYVEPLPAGDSVVVEVIPGELDVGFVYVGEAGSLYVETTPTQSCPPPEGVDFFGDFYDISTTATFDYITKVVLTNEGEFPPGVNAKDVRVFVHPSGECETWRDITVEMIDTEELRSPVLARIGKRLSEDDEFSVFAFAEDTRRVTQVIALKFDYLDSAITRNQSVIPSTEYTQMSDLLDRARTASGNRRYELAALRVDRIADVAINTPAIPHTYDPGAGQTVNVAGRLISRAHTLSFSLRLLTWERQLGNPPEPSWKDPAINIVEGSPDRLVAMPNPSQTEFILSFNAQYGRAVSVKVYSVEGELVKTLAGGERLTGAQSVTWDGRNDHGMRVAAGTYFAVLEDGEQRSVRKMVLQR